MSKSAYKEEVAKMISDVRLKVIEGYYKDGYYWLMSLDELYEMLKKEEEKTWDYYMDNREKIMEEYAINQFYAPFARVFSRC